MNKEEVLKLANLARIEIADSEAENLTREFEAIINYVGEVMNAASAGNSEPLSENHPVRNIMREDAETHEGGKYTEEILKGAPSREGEYVKVKKIL
jgi:aspartyl-tRNA(Asn)/glutamyl-tRNA(Gln) amidotransferase subunit C